MLRKSRPTFYSYSIEVNASGVHVITNVQGKPSEPPSLPLSLSEEMQGRAKRLAMKVRGKLVSANDIQELGELLYEALFGKNTQLSGHFRQCLATAAKKKALLHVTLDLDEEAFPDIASLPWEALRAPQEAGWPAIHFASDPRLTYVRQRKLWSIAEPRTRSGPLSIQLVVANKRSLDRDVEESLGPVEYEAVWQALQRLAEKHPNLIAPLPDPILHANTLSIKQALDKQPDILHFIGHGRMITRTKRELAQLALIGENDFIRWTDDTVIADLYKQHQPTLVFLQACEGGRIGTMHPFVGIASQLVHQNIPAVLAMQYSINNALAEIIVVTFYERLIQGATIDEAVQEVRYKLRVERSEFSRDAITPVLFSRLKEGRLFTVPSSQHKPARPATQFFSDQFVAQACSPIAVVCEAYNQATETIARFAQLDAILVNTVKYLAIIALAQYRSDNPKSEPLREWLVLLGHPRLVAWTQLLNDIVDSYEFGRRPPVAVMLCKALKTPVDRQCPMAVAERALVNMQGEEHTEIHSTYTFINQLVTYREKTWRDSPGRMDTTFCAPLIPLLQAALQQLFEECDRLIHYPLRFVTRLDKDGEASVYTQVEFRGSQIAPAPVKPFWQSLGHPQPARRLYLCTFDGQPLLNLHPFLVYIEHLSNLYFIDYNDQNRKIRYVPCGLGEAFIPPSYFSSFLLSLFNHEVRDPITILKKVENELDKLNAASLSSSDELFVKLLARMSADGKEAIELALGEALRIGRFWLGVEFLLAGLSRQRDQLFPLLLGQLEVDPSEFRALIRSLAGIVRGENWVNLDVHQLGRDNLQYVRACSPLTLNTHFMTAGTPSPYITLRMLTVLQRASALADKQLVGANQLLEAALEQSESIGTIVLFSFARQVDWSPEKVLFWIHLHSKPHEFGPTPVVSGLHPADVPPLREVAVDDASAYLDKYSRDLMAEAARPNSSLHAAKGETAHRTMVQIGRILLQRGAHSPLLLGKPGVGKTAIVEGFAYRLANGQVLPRLAQCRIVALFPADLLVDLPSRTECEERIQRLISEAKESQKRLVIFIDEIHTLFNAQTDSMRMLANVLKSLLMRGEFSCIGATTMHEYQRSIEIDKTWEQCFTPVQIKEPDIDEAMEIVRQVVVEQLVPHYEVIFLDEAIRASMELSAHYLQDVCLPGKAIMVLDEAASSSLLRETLSLSKSSADQGTVTLDTVLKVIATRTKTPVEQLRKNIQPNSTVE